MTAFLLPALVLIAASFLAACVWLAWARRVVHRDTLNRQAVDRHVVAVRRDGVTR
jgi:hypothetical protein